MKLFDFLIYKPKKKPHDTFRNWQGIKSWLKEDTLQQSATPLKTFNNQLLPYCSKKSCILILVSYNANGHKPYLSNPISL